jgi:hypothetical protein
MNRIEVSLQTGQVSVIPLTFEEVAALPPPPPPPVPPVISDRQFFQKLAVAGLITQADALAAVKTGTLPVFIQTIVNNLPPDDSFVAEMLLSGATEFDRNHPLVGQLAAAMGWAPEQIDQFWREAAAL